LLVSIGGLTVRHWSTLPKFFWLASRTLKQAKAAPGCVHAELFKKGKTYFALSVWEQPADMKRYAQNGLHAEVMVRAAETTISARNHSYQSERVPSRDAAYQCWLDSETSVN